MTYEPPTTLAPPINPMLWEKMNTLLQQPQYRCGCYDTATPGFTKVMFIGSTACACSGTILNRTGRLILAKIDSDGLDRIMENFNDHHEFEDN